MGCSSPSVGPAAMKVTVTKDLITEFSGHIFIPCINCCSCPWDSMPARNNVKGRIYFGSWFQRIWSTITQLHISGPIVGKDIVVVRVGHKSIFMLDKKQENTGRRPDTVPRTCPNDSRLPATPRFSSYHLY